MTTLGSTLSLIRSGPTKQGFTLVELMIALAIIGVLTTAALPSFLRYQLRARSSEALVNLSAIATTQEIYFAEHGEFLERSVSRASQRPGQQPKRLAARQQLRHARLGARRHRSIPVPGRRR